MDKTTDQNAYSKTKASLIYLVQGCGSTTRSDPGRREVIQMVYWPNKSDLKLTEIQGKSQIIWLNQNNITNLKWFINHISIPKY